MFNLRHFLLCASSALLLSVPSEQSSAAIIDFSDMGDANAYIFNDFTGYNNDSQGPLLIGGDAIFEGYTVGTLSDGNSLVLSVGGDLSVNGGDVNGLASVTGSTTVTSTNALRETTSTFAFDQNHFETLSTRLSTQNNTSNATLYSALNLNTLGGLDTYITSLPLAQLADFTSVFTTPEALGSRVVFNISGDVVNLTSKDWLIKTNDWMQHNESNILFNFYEATSLTINTSLYGSVLAPKADVFGNGGMINGQLIASSFTTGINGGGTQLNRPTFNADTPPSTANTVDVNEPTAIALLLAGLFGIGLRLKKR